MARVGARPAHRSGDRQPRTYRLQRSINGIRYVQRYGIPWMPCQRFTTIQHLLTTTGEFLVDGGYLERINHHLVMRDREKAARGQPNTRDHRCSVGQVAMPPKASAAMTAARKCSGPQATRGGRQRRASVGRQCDTGQRPDRMEASPCQASGAPLSWVETIVVDAGTRNGFIDAVQSGLSARSSVLRPEGAKGFVLLPKRWKVEQSIALSRLAAPPDDYERFSMSRAGAMLFASIGRLLASITIGITLPNGL